MGDLQSGPEADSEDRRQDVRCPASCALEPAHSLHKPAARWWFTSVHVSKHARGSWQMDLLRVSAPYWLLPGKISTLIPSCC